VTAPPADQALRPGSTRSPRGDAVVLIVAFVGITAVLVTAFAFGPLRPRTTGPRVAVVGDSLTNQSAWAIEAELDRHGYPSMVAGVNGADIARMTPQLISAVSPGGGAEVAVAALGTNNAFFAAIDDARHKNLAVTRRELDEAMRQALDGPADGTYASSARCLVWVNANAHTPVLDLPTNGTRFNEMLAERVATERARGRAVVLVDWAAVSRDRPEWFLPDGIHLTEVGQAAYARLIRQGVDDCPGLTT
jgi:hypothetical protein